MRTWSVDTPPLIPVRQVYVWLWSIDKKVVVVSKDGANWQLPGGKPAPDESREETAVREVFEETGIDIQTHVDRLKFFGYYRIHESETDYLQLRYFLPLPMESFELPLSATGEDQDQVDTDVIRFAEAVDLDEMQRRIGWIGKSEEYQRLLTMGMFE